MVSYYDQVTGDAEVWAVRGRFPKDTLVRRVKASLSEKKLGARQIGRVLSVSRRYHSDPVTVTVCWKDFRSPEPKLYRWVRGACRRIGPDKIERAVDA